MAMATTAHHHSVGYLVQAAVQQYTSAYTLTGYQGYGSAQRSANVTGADLAAKENAFYAYSLFDNGTCGGTTSCSGTGYASWLERQYPDPRLRPPVRDLALHATATASSQNTITGQTANKAIDGIINGYPGDYTKEWATVGGGVGSWLKLAWASPETVNMIVLYDRPNPNDQITGGTIQFSDGSTVNIGPLNNDGSATAVSFSARTITSLQLNITSVSPTTRNVGLAEIQVFGTFLFTALMSRCWPRPLPPHRTPVPGRRPIR